MKLLTTFLLGLLLTFCGERPNVLERVKKSGELRFVTWKNPTTYYQGPDGPTGTAYDLATRFAEHLGVNPRPVDVGTVHAVIPALLEGQGDLAAARLPVTPALKQRVRFGPTYQSIDQVVVFRRGNRKPRTLQDLAKGHLEVVAGSSEAQRLRELLAKHPLLSWRENQQADQAELISMVNEQLIDYTIANVDEVTMAKRFFAELRTGFNFGDPVSLAWAFPPDTDDSLYIAAIRFFNLMRKNGELEQLVERHFGHLERLDPHGTRKFMLRAKQRLPRYLKHFQEAAEEHGLDWRLLAAIGYQESHWDPKAVSPTGVRGIMMLTRDTAKDLGVKNRRDPKQSISGGTRYLVEVKEKIPERIPEPDRTWLALASYNIGFGHLEDARRLTQRLGGDPDRWVDVKKHLPLLSKKKWYKQTRFGYARGGQPVHYVANVRRYYELLVWIDSTDNREVAHRTLEDVDSDAL